MYNDPLHALLQNVRCFLTEWSYSERKARCTVRLSAHGEALTAGGLYGSSMFTAKTFLLPWLLTWLRRSREASLVTLSGYDFSTAQL